MSVGVVLSGLEVMSVTATDTSSIDCTGGSLLLVGIMIRSNSGQDVANIAIGGVPMKMVYKDTFDGYIFLVVFARQNPPQTTVTLRTDLSASANNWLIFHVLLSDTCDQNPIGDVSGVYTIGAETLTTGTITGEATEGMIVDFFLAMTDVSASLAPNGAQTQLQMDNGATEITGGCSYKVVASGTMNWSWTGSQRARLVGVPVFSQMAEVRVPVSRELK
jgi:hypothetical protein